MKPLTYVVILLTTAKASALALPSPAAIDDLTTRDTPSYCNVPYNVGSGTNQADYYPKCGISFFGQSMYSYWHTVAATGYLDCLNKCDNDATCIIFSFNKSEAAAGSTSNCLIIEQEDWHGIDPPYIWDNDIDSGDYDIADSIPPPSGGTPCC